MEKQINRAQKRHDEKVRKEADAVYQGLVQKFVQFFLSSDNPDDVRAKAKEVSAKWKMFCHRMTIKPEFHDLVKKYCDDYIRDYENIKASE